MKGRLNNLLVEVTRHNFQAVAEDVRLRIHNLEEELNDMGPGRHTPNDQRNHLIRIATDVREITSRAVDAYYGRDPCFEDNTFRLATNVMTMNKSFSDAIAQKGCTRRFRTQSSENDTTAALEPRIAGHETFASSTDSLDTPITPKSGTENQLLREYPELKVLMGPPVPAPAKPKQDIIQWITKQYKRSKGFEIRTLNLSLLPALFSEQSKSWEFFASGHMENVVQAIHHFTCKALQHCCKDAALSKRLWGRLSQLLLPRYKLALDQAIFLIKVEQQGNLLTMNHYFADNLRKAREDRIKKQLVNLQSWTTNDSLKQPLLRLEDTITAFLNNEDQITQDLHDTLEAYYKYHVDRHHYGNRLISTDPLLC